MRLSFCFLCYHSPVALLAHFGQAQQVIPVVDKMLPDSIGENATRNGNGGHLTFIRRMTKNYRDEVGYPALAIRLPELPRTNRLVPLR